LSFIEILIKPYYLIKPYDFMCKLKIIET